MKSFKSRLTKSEKTQITEMIQTFSDSWGEFYLTKNNMRLYIRENPEVLFNCLKDGDKICYNKNAIIIITGFSDNFNRHYMKFLTKTPANIDELLKEINWNITCDLFVKIKKNNPLLSVLKNNCFSFFKDRGKEILLLREYIKEVK